MKFFVWMPCLYFSIQHLSQHHSLFPLKNKTAKNNEKTSLKCLNSWQVSKSLRVSLVVFSRDQYWAQIYWKFSWMSGKLILNPADKIFSGGMISSPLTIIGAIAWLWLPRTKQMQTSLSRKKECRSGWKVGDVLESNDWNGWAGYSFTSLKRVFHSPAHNRNELTPSCILRGVQESTHIVVMLCTQLWNLLL